MRNYGIFCTLTLCLSTFAFGQDQGAQAPTTPPAAPPADAPPPTAWTYKGFSASGYVDVYYNQNENNPSSRFSQVQALNITANKFSLNSATASFSYDANPIGFRVDVGDGRTYDSYFLSEPKHTDWSRHLLNAYVTLKPKGWKGVTVDFGKFVTSAGAEVTETHLNWNYSRSLLFAFGPYYHTGLRVTVPVTPTWSVGGQAVTGWNLMRDNNSGKTFGFTSLNTLKKVVVSNNYYTGPENNNTNKGWRNFYDLAVTVTATDRISAYYNLDIGNSKYAGGGSGTFWGMATAARFALTKHLAVSPRIEYYSDKDGFWTGTPQAFKEFTGTGEWKFNDSFIARLEYRRDWSDQPFFQVGQVPGASKHQTMITAGFMMVLKPGMFSFSK